MVQNEETTDKSKRMRLNMGEPDSLPFAGNKESPDVSMEDSRRQSGPPPRPPSSGVSPMERMSRAGGNSSSVPTKDSSELYTVDESTDTVRGQLDNYTDFDTPLMKRIAQQGIDQAAGRGLTNSSIAGGNAIGKVLDKAGEWATTDAGAYNNRKTESLRSATSVYGIDESAAASRYGSDKSLEGTQLSADASKYGAVMGLESSRVAADASKYGSDKSLEGTRYSSDKSAEASMYGADKGLEGSLANATATVAAAGINAQGRIAAEKINATSNEKIQASRADIADADRKSNVLIKVLDGEQQKEAAAIKARTARGAAQKDAYNTGMTAAGNNFTIGVANIDITASPKSQKEQYARLKGTYDVEMANLLLLKL
jgi:hypothetical protein